VKYRLVDTKTPRLGVRGELLTLLLIQCAENNALFE